jgi:molybdate transport system substrate-binding protein
MILLASVAQATLTVSAAASLHLAFPALAQQFAATHLGVSVRFSFNGSQILEAQLENGAPADVFASADQRWMDKAVAAKVVGQPLLFASNQLELVAALASKVYTPHDLAAAGTKLVLCAEAVPCGAYSRRLLEGMDSDPTYGAGYSKAVLANVVSDELDVESVLGKVELGEADAGIVYRTDAAGKKDVRAIDLPALPGTPIGYYIGAVQTSSQPQLAADFVSFVNSPAGQKILESFGFSKPSP